MVDDVLGLGKLTTEALSLVKEPVKALCGPAFEEIAGTFGDQMRHWRDMRRINLAIAAVGKLKEKGISPKAVEPSLLFPILDAGSLVDDPDLKDKWTTLLSTAATPDAEPVLPSYSAVLSQLSAVEVRVLDIVYKKYVAAIVGKFIRPEEVIDMVGVTFPVARTILTNLGRLGIVRESHASSVNSQELLGMIRENMFPKNSYTHVSNIHVMTNGHLTFTEFSGSFMQACIEVPPV